MKKVKFLKLFLLIVIFPLVVSCNRADKDLEEVAEKKYKTAKSKKARRDEKMGGYIFDEPLFGVGKDSAEETNIGVNSYLWRATLDTLSILPKKKIDPFGGAVLTEWYQPNGEKKQRLKVEVIIIGRKLKAGTLRVSIFRQENVDGEWQDRLVSQEVIDQFEESILTRAREIRIAEEK